MTHEHLDAALRRLSDYGNFVEVDDIEIAEARDAILEAVAKDRRAELAKLVFVLPNTEPPA